MGYHRTMKAPPFNYHAPTSIGAAIELLASQPNARLLAGGQSLMPMLNFRLTHPDHLIDLNRIGELAYIREAGGEVAIGAMTRQREVEFSPLVAQRLPLLAAAIRWVGHRQTRNRGTVGGSLCHLDPSAEIPAVAMALDANLTIRSPRGERTITMREFARDLMTTALEPDELLTELRLTAWPVGHGAAFVEFARRHGDFAIIAVAAMVVIEGGRIRRASITVAGVNSTALRLTEAEQALIGAAIKEAPAIGAAIAANVTAMGDATYPSWYRQKLAGSLTRRALVAAIEKGPA